MTWLGNCFSWENDVIRHLWGLVKPLKYILKLNNKSTRLTHFRPMFLFSTPWKHNPCVHSNLHICLRVVPIFFVFKPVADYLHWLLLIYLRLHKIIRHSKDLRFYCLIIEFCHTWIICDAYIIFERTWNNSWHEILHGEMRAMISMFAISEIALIK